METLVISSLLNIMQQALQAAGVAVLQDIINVVQHHAAQGVNILDPAIVAQVAAPSQASSVQAAPVAPVAQ